MKRTGIEAAADSAETARRRKPRSDWEVGNVEAWVGRYLGIPREAVRLMLPGGKRRARNDKTLGALRSDWKA